MHRFYCPSQNISSDKIIIFDKEGVHHLKDVLRIKTKDEIIVFDTLGNEYTCLVEKLSDKVVLDIQERHLSFNRQPRDVKVTIACAIPKKSKMDEIVDKLTQLGVDRVAPLLTERVIIKLDKQKKISRLKRWKKIALSASQQSQRNTLPVIAPIKNLKEALSEARDYDLKLIPTLAGKRKALKEVLANFKAKNILVLIGPEGDFSPSEIDLAKKAGCISISLGDLVLRVDTAAIAVASFIKLYLYEDH